MIRRAMVEKLKIGSIVIRCYEFDKMLAFWRQALHYVHREPVEGGWVILHDPDGNLFCVVQVPLET